jgi:hypothetical protein
VDRSSILNSGPVFNALIPLTRVLAASKVSVAMATALEFFAGSGLVGEGLAPSA